VRIRLLIVSVLAGIIVPVAGADESGGIGVRLVDVPAASRDNPLARAYIVNDVAPGTSIRRRVEIVNSTRSTAAIAVYPAAAALSRGNFAFAPGRGRNELSSWTSVSRDVLRLAPRTKALETVTIDVPEDASSGRHFAVIWAEVSAPPPAGGGVTLVNRVGIRMYFSVGPGGALPADFAIGALTAERSSTGEPVVVVIVRNTGGRSLAIRGSLALAKGPGGLRAGPFPVELGSGLEPGDSAPATVRLDKQVPRGPWQASIRLRSGSVQRTAVGTISFPLVVGAAKPLATEVDRTALLRFLSVVGGLLVLLALAALALLLFRRSGPRTPRPVL
jgi:hypothetical protein